MRSLIMTPVKILFLSFLFSILFTHPVFADQKITLSPFNITLPENGGSQVFEVKLIEPIITPSPNPAFLTMTLTSSDPRVLLTPSTITYMGTEWSQVKQFTVTTVGDNIVNPNNLVRIGISVSSNSEYYDKYTTSTSLTLIDDDRQAPVLMETTPIPAQITTTSAVYHFSTTGDTTGYEPLTDCPGDVSINLSQGTVSFSNLVLGQTYGNCNFGLTLNHYPNSNVLHIGSFFVGGNAAPVLIASAPSKLVSNTVSAQASNVPVHITFTKNLKKGMDDPDVSQLQKFLDTHGFPVAHVGWGSLDKLATVFGINTVNALKQYQASVNLPATGYFGLMTRNYINNVLLGSK